MTEKRLYGYGDLGTAKRVISTAYKTDAAYVDKYIRNRPVTSYMGTMANRQEILLSANTYDAAALTERFGLRLRNPSAGAGMTVRGNVTRVQTPGSIQNIAYDVTGMATTANDGYGASVSVAPNGSITAPQTITPNNQAQLATTYSYDGALRPTATAYPNSASDAKTYEHGRVKTVTSVHSAVTTMTYNSATQTTAATNNGGRQRWTRTTTDGLGRPVKTELGYGATVESIVDTEYGPCACSPAGKMMRTTRPYKPGEPVSDPVACSVFRADPNSAGKLRTVPRAQPIDG